MQESHNDRFFPPYNLYLLTRVGFVVVDFWLLATGKTQLGVRAQTWISLGEDSGSQTGWQAERLSRDLSSRSL